MSVIYRKIQQIVGPLVFVKNEHNVQYGEIVKIVSNNGETRTGQVVKMDQKIIVIEVFEDTTGLSTLNSKVIFTDDSFKIKLSKDMLGRTFNSLGKPIDISTKKILEADVITNDERDVNGAPINPFAREYPSDIIQTGIKVIDGLFTLIRGQKLPIFSGQGMPHNKLAAQIVTQAKLLTEEPFLVIFCGIGIIRDEVIYFLNRFKESGNIQNIISFINFADDPIMERILIPRVALTTAEYFAFEKDMHVLIVLIDMTNYAEALRELSSAKEEIPSRKGYPGYLYSDFASLYERTGKIKGKNGSITQIPILTMPNDDISHPIPDTTAYITEGQLVLNRELHKKGIYPPLEILASISRLMKDAIGEGTTREDHAEISSQILSSYSNSLEVRDLISIVGEEGLSSQQKALIDFGEEIENTFINQDLKEDCNFEETFNIAWEVLSRLSRNQLVRIKQKYINKYYVEGV
ncbi:MAG: V-type ATP synthase subunit B [Candidatus Lokiarchaeota archaeon]|nr:V-type ATP synthase subunit B [Candidatus Lokiarchaeota archaeon]MBD3339262.1 V-type ATP synthase subunit B [Candidatus Lokiarchaeota archaeon]